MKFLTSLFILILNLSILTAAEHKTSVGLGLIIEGVEISGSKVIPVPRLDYKSPIVLRIVSSEKIDDGYSYNIHAEGLAPANYDLAKYLKREDNTPLEIEPIPFEVISILSKPLEEPRKLTSTKPKGIGGYTTFLWVFGILWLAVLLGIIFYKKRNNSPRDEQAPPPTLTDKITALLRQSDDKKLNTENQAKLERLLIGHWIEKFPELKDKPMSESLTFLRNNEESRPMIRSVERWLHSGEKVTAAEIRDTLAPYSEQEEAQK